MPKVPAFILRRLYVKGSLENTSEGWRFSIKNSLGSGYAHKMLPLTLDGEEIPMHLVFFQKEDEEVSFAEVDMEKTFTIRMNSEITISVKDRPLSMGTHKVFMGFTVPGFGDLGFDFSDEVKDD